MQFRNLEQLIRLEPSNVLKLTHVSLRSEASGLTVTT